MLLRTNDYLYEVEIIGRQLVEHGVMQRDGIGRVEVEHHIRSNLRGMCEHVGKTRKRIMA